MRLPIQSQPVQRNIPSQPFAYGGSNGTSDGGRGVLASAYGVQPDGWFDDVINVVQKVGQVAGTVAPVLGSFGI